MGRSFTSRDRELREIGVRAIESHLYNVQDIQQHEQYYLSLSEQYYLSLSEAPLN